MVLLTVKMQLTHLILLASAVLAVSGLNQQKPLSRILPPNDDEYTVLTHKALPGHRLRLRHHEEDMAFVSDIEGDTESISKYCSGATSGYTGYLSTDNDTKHFYFAYFNSRSDPDNDPLVMWINGGPGCSSMMGLFMELGPCRVNDFGNGTIKNEYSWTETANVFFLDQPIGVGFSYDSSGDVSNGTFAASEDIHAFMLIWYSFFPDTRKNPFSIAGESYGGHYIPIFASHILAENELATVEGRMDDLIPLNSVMIGNGIFDPLRQTTSSWDIVCTNVTGIGPVLSDGVCQKMAKHIDRCEYLWKACYDYPDKLICEAATGFCEKHIEMPYAVSGRNYYDISKPCSGELCYGTFIHAITTYLNRDDVRNAFGVDKAVKQFESCSNAVGRSYSKAGDGYLPTTEFTSYLLNKGLRVLMYVGTYDWICNFVGNERFLLALPWEGGYGYRHAATYEQKEWTGGQWWEFENLRYARIQGAGHMVPYDKPQVALSMVKAWLTEKPLA